MRLAIITFLFFILFSGVAEAANINGNVLDASTGEPLIGVTLQLVGHNVNTVTGMDGSFSLKGLDNGSYTLSVSYVGYITKTQPISISQNNTLTLSIELEEELRMIGEVVVSAKADRNTEFNARATERKAPNLLNVVSSQTIETSPDITVANVIQRVSGISLERSQTGDGQHAIIRGMDKRYNYSLVNGIKIPSPDNDNRFVPLDIFPSDLMERIELSKSLTPDMEGDAIGGVINMVLKDAPEEFTMKLNIGSGFNTMFFNEVSYSDFNHNVVSSESPVMREGLGYRADMNDFPLVNADINQHNFQPLNQLYGLSVGSRFGAAKKFGVMLAGSYQQTARASNSTFFGTRVNDETNIPELRSVTNSIRSSRQVRSGVHVKADYRINSKNTIDIYSSLISLKEFETRDMIDTNLVISRQGPGTGRIENWIRTRQRISTILTNNISGEHQLFPVFKVDWSAVYSTATYEDPDMSEFMVISGISRGNDGGMRQSPFLYDNTNYRGFWRRWRGNEDTDIAGYLNFSYTPNILGTEGLIKFGGMYRSKARENYFDRYRLNPSPARQEFTGSVLDNTFIVGTPGGTTRNALNYTLDENILATYAMTKINLTDLLSVTGGVRMEQTDLSWVSNAPDNVEGRIGNINYTDFLPSVNAKYDLSSNQNLRASYFESISRQGYFEIIPYAFYEDDQFREAGNPNLERAYARNFDLRYELFPNPLDKLMVGVFYKEIQNPIEFTVVRRPDLNNDLFLSPGNFGTAENYGFELDFVKYFKRIGFRGNYTFTTSEITTDKLFKFRDEEGMLTNRIEEETRPLQGQSRHLGNLSFIVKDDNVGYNAQLSAVYTGDRIAFVSPYLGNDQWQRAVTQLDFSLEQKFMRNFTAYLKVNNLLNAPYELEIRQPNSIVANESELQTDDDRVLTRIDYFQRTVLFGLRYAL